MVLRQRDTMTARRAPRCENAIGTGLVAAARIGVGSQEIGFGSKAPKRRAELTSVSLRQWGKLSVDKGNHVRLLICRITANAPCGSAILYLESGLINFYRLHPRP